MARTGREPKANGRSGGPIPWDCRARSPTSSTYTGSPNTPRASTSRDDPRLYIILASQGIPTTLLTQRRRRGEPPEVRGEKTASRLMRKQPMKIVLAMHDRQTPDHHRNDDQRPPRRQGDRTPRPARHPGEPRPQDPGPGGPSPQRDQSPGSPAPTAPPHPERRSRKGLLRNVRGNARQTSGETSEKMSELTPSPRTADGQRPDGDPSPALSKSTPQPDPEPDPRPDPPGGHPPAARRGRPRPQPRARNIRAPRGPAAGLRPDRRSTGLRCGRGSVPGNRGHRDALPFQVIGHSPYQRYQRCWC